MEITQTKDTEYVKSVLSGQGMQRLCLGGCQKEMDIMAAVENPANVYFEIKDEGERRGFISLTSVGSGKAIIHLALQTRKYKTLHSVLEVLKQASSFGFKEIIAFYPETRRSVRRIADLIGFKTVKEHVPVPGFSDLMILQSIQI